MMTGLDLPTLDPPALDRPPPRLVRAGVERGENGFGAGGSGGMDDRAADDNDDDDDNGQLVGRGAIAATVDGWNPQNWCCWKCWG